MWKLYNSNILGNISDLFQLRQSIYGANNLKYLVPNANIGNTKNNLLFQNPSLWNNLPADLKNTKTISLFKKMLKRYIDLLDINR